MSISLKELILESNSLLLEKLNLGDFTEGLFAFSLYTLLKKGSLTVADLQAARKALKLDAKQPVTKYADKSARKQGSLSLGVELKVSLKTERIAGGFGASLESSKDIDKLLEVLARDIPNLPEVKTLMSLVEKASKLSGGGNSLVVSIVSDGVAGEGSGGTVKADVQLNIKGSPSVAGKKELKDLAESIKVINYSLKYKSITAANLSPIAGTLKIASTIGLKPNYVTALTKATNDLTKLRKEYADLRKAGTKPNVLMKKRQGISDATNALARNLVNGIYDKVTTEQNFEDLIRRMFSVIEQSVFGTDGATLLAVETNEIKTISKKNVDEIKKALLTNDNLTIGAEIDEAGTKLKVYMENTDNGKYVYLFQFRYKIASSQSDPLKPPEIKFYIETQPGIYMTAEQILKQLS